MSPLSVELEQLQKELKAAEESAEAALAKDTANYTYYDEKVKRLQERYTKLLDLSIAIVQNSSTPLPVTTISQVTGVAIISPAVSVVETNVFRFSTDECIVSDETKRKRKPNIAFKEQAVLDINLSETLAEDNVIKATLKKRAKEFMKYPFMHTTNRNNDQFQCAVHKDCNHIYKVVKQSNRWWQIVESVECHKQTEIEVLRPCGISYKALNYLNFENKQWTGNLLY